VIEQKFSILSGHLKELHLPAFRQHYRGEADLARQESLEHEEYLLELARRECEERAFKRTQRYLRESRLPNEKIIETFDRERLPVKLNSLVQHLLEGSFLDRFENVLAFGKPGSGKTHLLCAIGHALIQQGRRVLYAPCSLLVQDLLMAKRELSLAKHLKKLSKYHALIIDDIGYVQQDREEMEVLFTLLADRYERGTVMLTSNLPFSKWGQIFKDPMTTAAAIDRLVHHCIILELNLPSYRLEKSQEKQEKG
jgi:DNA replication protein DnaC